MTDSETAIHDFVLQEVLYDKRLPALDLEESLLHRNCSIPLPS
jgi:hypothetical protein